VSLNPRYLVIHTAAYRGACDRDTIDRWHRDRGWSGIGYHYVINNGGHASLKDGEVEVGRAASISGAHARGINSQSLGICCTGHGDYDDFSEAQKQSLVVLLSDLIDDNEELLVESVIGHREINRLVSEGRVKKRYRTAKSCPGKKVDMDALRARLREFREQATEAAIEPADDINDQQIRDAIVLLERAGARYPNARDELREFVTHPEVQAILD
jgi:N-acetylmuramoyl-L-alanine amidase